ncbi:hypothetical protein [Kitasatospora purpeofusca]|uniref:hypothetical protein n=1 Tax=Kitasatospora purpeofusca TaxID=67352 RepID=UPI00381018C6
MALFTTPVALLAAAVLRRRPRTMDSRGPGPSSSSGMDSAGLAMASLTPTSVPVAARRHHTSRIVAVAVMTASWSGLSGRLPSSIGRIEASKGSKGDE